MPRPSAAEAMYPHLTDRPAPSPSQQRNASPLAAALYPGLVPPKPPSAHVILMRRLLRETTESLRKERLQRDLTGVLP
jgi:hypothetical protein